MKKILILVVAIFVFSSALTGCGHTHEWKPATCMFPKTCTGCGETAGEVLEHEWIEATCQKAKYCTLCGLAQGEPIEHSWSAATCTVPQTCNACGATEGVANGHSWSAATCTAPQTCNVCGATEGVADGHSWSAATCTAPQTCNVCGVTEGAANGHSWEVATCVSPKICTNCGATNGSALGHSWATSSVYSKNCKVCGVVEIDQSKLPVKLGSLKPCVGPNYSSKENKSDIYGNTFSEGLQLYHEAWSTGNHQGSEYVLNREYKTFTAKVMIHSLRDDFEVNLKIYVDGVVAYDSGVMTKKTQPIDISVDVSNAMFLKIETHKTKGAGTVMISEPLLHH